MKKILLQLAAAITFFTRLPLWKVLEIPSESFKKIICFYIRFGSLPIRQLP